MRGSAKKLQEKHLISISKQCAEHPFAGRNTQQQIHHLLNICQSVHVTFFNFIQSHIHIGALGCTSYYLIYLTHNFG